MKIQVGHLRKSNFEEKLYNPLRKSSLYQEHNFLFPHEEGKKSFNSKETLKEMDVFIAEVSSPATGLGIEIGFAHLYKVPIICVYKKGAKIAGSLKYVTTHFVEYSNSEELISGIKEKILEIKN